MQMSTCPSSKISQLIFHFHLTMFSLIIRHPICQVAKLVVWKLFHLLNVSLEVIQGFTCNVKLWQNIGSWDSLRRPHFCLCGLNTVSQSNYTYLLISNECTLYLLSSLYLPGWARGSIATLFLYLTVGGRKHGRRQTKGSRKNFENRIKRRINHG